MVPEYSEIIQKLYKKDRKLSKWRSFFTKICAAKLCAMHKTAKRLYSLLVGLEELISAVVFLQQTSTFGDENVKTNILGC